MKIFDCFMYFDEDVVLDVRLNFLDKFVDKFIIIESEYNHKGEKRIPLFNINKFKKFKNKIRYILCLFQFYYLHLKLFELHWVLCHKLNKLSYV